MLSVSENRQNQIHSKGFNIMRGSSQYLLENGEVDFSKIKVGAKSLDDAVLNLNAFSKINQTLGDKEKINQALAQKNYDTLRQISNYYYGISGIYQRLCKYLAHLYKYDWYVIPYLVNDKANSDNALKDFAKVLEYLDNSNVRKFFGDCALDVIRDGCYYGYMVDDDEKLVIQQLPIAYCRSRFYHNNEPAVEFNMKYFDDCFTDAQYRFKVLKMFPKEFSKGYVLYKEGKLQGDYVGDQAGWYLLDPEHTVKFNFNNSDYPVFASVIPAIIDLNEAQEVDKKKMLQQLLKIIIQKLPIDKNGDLIFDVDEAKDLHNNAVQMLKRAIGIDVLTTFADIDVANMSDRNTVTSTDDLAKVERGVYNAAGVSHNVFNTDGNTALNISIADDEATMRNLVYQFEIFLNRVIQRFNRNKKKYYFKVRFLETTTHNYKDLSKLYKEHVQLGYSKMLPQIALGHSQSEILAMINFENKILKLSEVMVPPMMSSVMSGKSNNSADKTGKTEAVETEDKQAGRKELPDNEKSEKTIANKEALG